MRRKAQKIKSSIGQELKKKRMEKKISIEDVYEKTKIHPRIITALEEGRAEQRLNQVYIKNFLCDYAKLLDLDAGAIIKEYFKGSRRHSGHKKKGGLFFVFSKMNPARLLFILFAMFCVLIFAFLGHEKVNAPIIEGRKAPAQVNLKPASFSGILEKETLELEIKAKKEVWMQIKCDERIVFKDILKEGATQNLNAREAIELWVGNGKALELTLNGQNLGSLSSGVIKNIIITAEGMRIGAR